MLFKKKFKMNKIDIIPAYDIEEINFVNYTDETKKIILSNFRSLIDP